MSMYMHLALDISALGGSAPSGGSKTSVVGGTRHFRLLVEKP